MPPKRRRRIPPSTLLPRATKHVKLHLANRSAFDAFTGQDMSAWCAFVFAVELWSRSDAVGQHNALIMMRLAVHSAQRHEDVLSAFKKAITVVLDWSEEGNVWKQIAPTVELNDIERDLAASLGATAKRVIWPCPDGALVCAHVHSKPSKVHRGYLNCKDCGVTWQAADNAAGEVVL